MNRLPLHIFQLRHPSPNIISLGIVLFALEEGVEDAEVGLGVDARAGAEAPAAVVGGEVAVDQVFHEEAFAEAPVKQEVFGEEGGDGHARAVVHGACVQQLAHGGVNEGEACLAGAPGLEVRGIVFPGYVGVFGFEGFVHAGGGKAMNEYTSQGRVGGGEQDDLPYIRPVGQDVLVKVSPGYFGNPGDNAGVAAI